ncbi:FAD-dependent monooxygenase [Streptomyces sp. NPDC021093]|uniref:FAD-dependent monooxygenase n=1 Tax=Streptomyces sp. NPDC021093 TaxID=3365112 RepID=UPI00379E06F3
MTANQSGTRRQDGRRTRAIVIGAGIGGLAAAVALRKVGIDVQVFERASKLQAAGSGLSVMSNALAALDSLDIDLELEKYGQTLESYDIRNHQGELIRSLPIAEVIEGLGAPSVCISRPALQTALLTAAGDVPIALGAVATGFEPVGDGVRVTFQDGSHAEADLLIGADGFHSAIRRELVRPEGADAEQSGPEPHKDSGYICWLGIIPFEHPRMTTGSVHHYWGSGRRFGLIDIGHGNAYWWGTKNMPAAESADWRGGPGGKEQVLSAYEGWADEVQQAILQTPEDKILGVPSRDRVFLERWGKGPVTLLGDAAHPMLTSLGQGSGLAIEDAVVLAQSLRDSTDPVSGLRSYEDTRRERTRQLVAASRSLSDFEQVETPEACAERDEYFRTVPHRTLVEQQTDSMTFPLPATT